MVDFEMWWITNDLVTDSTLKDDGQCLGIGMDSSAMDGLAMHGSAIKR